MKIAIICPYELPVPAINGGAVETLVEQLVKNNQEYKLADITIFSIENSNVEETSQKYSNSEFKYLKFKRRNTFYNYLNACFHRFRIKYRIHPCISKIQKKTIMDFDVVIIENDIQCVLPLRKKYNGKIVLHIHSDTLNISTKDSVEIANACDLILSVSDFIKDRIKKINKKINVKTLYNVVDLDLFKMLNNQNELKIELGLKSSDIVVGYCGRLTAAKGVDKLIEAFINLTISKNEAKLLIIGASDFGRNEFTPFTQKLTSAAQKLNKKIIFTGYVKHEDVPLYLNACDFLVVPSQCNEALPLAVLEGMATGIPVIGSKIGGIPELIKENEMLIPINEHFTNTLEETMIKLAEDKNKCNQIGSKNEGRIKKSFDAKYYLSTLLKLIG